MGARPLRREMQRNIEDAAPRRSFGETNPVRKSPWMLRARDDPVKFAFSADEGLGRIWCREPNGGRSCSWEALQPG